MQSGHHNLANEIFVRWCSLASIVVCVSLFCGTFQNWLSLREMIVKPAHCCWQTIPMKKSGKRRNWYHEELWALMPMRGLIWRALRILKPLGPCWSGFQTFIWFSYSFSWSMFTSKIWWGSFDRHGCLWFICGILVVHNIIDAAWQHWLMVRVWDCSSLKKANGWRWFCTLLPGCRVCSLELSFFAASITWHWDLFSSSYLGFVSQVCVLPLGFSSDLSWVGNPWASCIALFQ
jgi:hypothetical protein